MRQSIQWGLITGIASAAVAGWSDWLSSGKTVSLFPDLLSLLTLVVIATVALRRVMRGVTSVAEGRRRGVVFGVIVAAIVALATLVRGLAGWSTPHVVLASVTVVASFVIVLLIVAAVARVPRDAAV